MPSAHLMLWTRLRVQLHTSGGAGPPLEDGLVPAAEGVCAESKAVVAMWGGRTVGRPSSAPGRRARGTYPVRGETDRVVSSRGRAASRERSGGSRRVKANQKAARPRTTTVQYSTTCSTTLFNIHTHSDQTGQVRQSACRPSLRRR